MDRKGLVEELQKAFTDGSDKGGNTDSRDVEYKEDTNTLLVNEQTTYNVLKEPEIKKMTEEEVFDRLLKERRLGN